MKISDNSIVLTILVLLCASLIIVMLGSSMEINNEGVLVFFLIIPFKVHGLLIKELFFCQVIIISLQNAFVELNEMIVIEHKFTARGRVACRLNQRSNVRLLR